MDGAVAAALVPLALAVALPFRQIALARTPLLALGWDAALHATEGLDLFDDLRLARPLDALSLLASRHWWGPLWAVVSAPFQAVFGPSLSAASLPSLVAFVLTPSVAYLLVRRLAPGGLLVAAATALLAAVLFLRSPMLLETSAWPMLESLGGFLVLLAWLLFARRSEPRARRTAFLAGAGLFLLKYHYGFFVLVTFSAVVVLEETADARRRFGTAARAVLLRGAGAGILALACLLAAVRLILQARGGDAAARGAPSVPNVGWGAFVLLGFLLVLRRKQLAQAWNGASGTLRDFFLFGLLPPALWCLDPANVRGWYRQVFQPTNAPEWDPVAKLVSFGSFLRDDYTLGAMPAGLVLFGLLLALALPGDQNAPGARGVRRLACAPDVARHVSRGAPFSRLSRAGPPRGGSCGSSGGSDAAGRKRARARARCPRCRCAASGRPRARSLARRAGRAGSVSVCVRCDGDGRRECRHCLGACGRSDPPAASSGASGLAHSAAGAPSGAARPGAGGRGRLRGVAMR